MWLENKARHHKNSRKEGNYSDIISSIKNKTSAIIQYKPYKEI